MQGDKDTRENPRSIISQVYPAENPVVRAAMKGAQLNDGEFYQWVYIPHGHDRLRPIHLRPLVYEIVKGILQP